MHSMYLRVYDPRYGYLQHIQRRTCKQDMVKYMKRNEEELEVNEINHFKSKLETMKGQWFQMQLIVLENDISDFKKVLSTGRSYGEPEGQR